MDTPYKLEQYDWKDLSTAPAGPGLYAWYVRPELRVADLSDGIRTKKNLLEVMSLLRIPTLYLRADGHLSMRFEGTLAHTVYGSDLDEEFTSLVDSVIANPAQRSFFADVLLAATPALMAPLYVGVAIDLRSRLGQHRDSIQKYSAQHLKHPHEETGAAMPHSFAREVARRQISPNQLVVYTCQIPFSINATLNHDEQRRVAEAVETVLNRIFFPIFGRR